MLIRDSWKVLTTLDGDSWVPLEDSYYRFLQGMSHQDGDLRGKSKVKAPTLHAHDCRAITKSFSL